MAIFNLFVLPFTVAETAEPNFSVHHHSFIHLTCMNAYFVQGTMRDTEALETSISQGLFQGTHSAVLTAWGTPSTS